MKVIKPKIELHKIFACPECRYRKFTSIRALNTHFTKEHKNKKLKFYVKRGRGMAKSTKKPVKVIWKSNL